MPDFDSSVPHIARVYDYWLGRSAASRSAAQLIGRPAAYPEPPARPGNRSRGHEV